MSLTGCLRRVLFLALMFAGSAQAALITLPATSELNVLGFNSTLSVAWVHSFTGVGNGLPEEGGKPCDNLGSSAPNEICAVRADSSLVPGQPWSYAIQKYQFEFDEGTGKPTITVENGPLATEGQKFTFDIAAAPFGGSFDDGTWSYNTAPPFVTAWATKGGSDGYTIFYLVLNDQIEYEGSDPIYVPGYTGIPVPFSDNPLEPVLLPFGTFGMQPERPDLSNIIFFDSDGQFPPGQVPEPGSLLLLGAALAGLGALKRRRS